MKIHFDMPRGAKISLTLNEPHRLLSIHIQTQPLSIHYKWKEIIDIVYKTTEGKVMANQFQTETPIQLKGSLYW